MSISPMLCQGIESKTLAQYNPDEWFAEPKLDGERIIAIRQGDTIQMWTRRGKEVSKKFPEVKIALTFLTAKEWVLDGELCVKGGFTNLLKRNTDNPTHIAILKVKYPATYHIFDVLKVGETDVTNLPLYQRKACLISLFPNDKMVIGFVKDVVKLVPTLKCLSLYDTFLTMLEQGFEGIVIKRKYSPYQYDKRSTDWIKALILARNGAY
jgi:DNA ligase-1